MANREATELKDDLLKEIRDRITIKGKVPSFLESLNDADLWGAFTLLRQGANLSEVSRFLIDRGAYTGNVAACRPLVDRLKKKLLPLLVGNGKPKAPAPVPEPIPEGLTELERIDQMAARYQAVINRELIEAESGGALSQTLSRHVQALTALLKQKSKLQLEAEKQAWSMARGGHYALPGLQEKFAEFRGQFSDGGRLMVMATKKLMEFADEEAVELEDDDDLIQ